MPLLVFWLDMKGLEMRERVARVAEFGLLIVTELGGSLISP